MDTVNLYKCLKSYLPGHSVKLIADNEIEIDSHKIIITDKIVMIDGDPVKFNGSVKNLLKQIEKSRICPVNWPNIYEPIAGTYELRRKGLIK
jgi:hypothetical protein